MKKRFEIHELQHSISEFVSTFYRLMIPALRDTFHYRPDEILKFVGGGLSYSLREDAIPQQIRVDIVPAMWSEGSELNLRFEKYLPELGWKCFEGDIKLPNLVFSSEFQTEDQERPYFHLVVKTGWVGESGYEFEIQPGTNEATRTAVLQTKKIDGLRLQTLGNHT